MAERGLDLGVAEPRQALAGRTAGGDRGQALLGVAAVLLHVQRDHRLDGGPAVGVEVAPRVQVIGQAPGLVERPGLERGDELGLVDQPVLKGEQSEEEMAVGSGGHREPPDHGVVTGMTGYGISPEHRFEKCLHRQYYRMHRET